MSRTTGRQGVHRALLVLGLLAGLFAMHGMTANHDMPPMGTSAVGSTAPHPPAAMVHPAQPPTAAPTASLAHVVSASEPDRGLGGHSGAEMCMAILLTALALTLLLAAGRRHGGTLPRVLRVASLAATWPHAHRRRVFCLSLTELSLSRT